jgi:PhnB protein
MVGWVATSDSKIEIQMIIPMLVCRDAAAEIDFCKQAFGAVEISRRTGEDRAVVHATLRIRDSILMVHDVSPHLASQAPALDGSCPVVNYLYGDEVDSVIERAVTAGAKILLPAADQFWGDRVGRIIDPSGHVWNIAARIKAKEAQ